jgi:hypothetical protein
MEWSLYCFIVQKASLETWEDAREPEKRQEGAQI